MHEVNEYERLKVDILETLDIVDIRLLSIETALQQGKPFVEQVPFVKSCMVNLCATLSKLPSHRDALQLANEILQYIQFSLAGKFEIQTDFVSLLLRAVDALRESFAETDNGQPLESIAQALKEFDERVSSGDSNREENPSSTVHFLPPTSLRKLRALVIDSNTEECQLFGEILAKLNIEIEQATDGAEGILKFTQDPELDVVLVNLERTDGADGHTFLEVIENLYQKRHIPKRARCIVYSTSMSYPLLKSLLEYECVYAVRSAPIEREKLLETVLGVLSYRGKLLSLASG
jgi:CheY-like chemotaxis protein